MPWKEVTVIEEKMRFIAAYQSWVGPFRQLCESFHISTKTGYKLVKRFKELGNEGLQEQSRKPQCSPKKTVCYIEELIVQTRQLHPAWAGEKIKRYLQRKGYDALPSEKTIDRILKRYGLITEEESQKHKPWKHFEHKNPNDLWQMDFKGYIETEIERCHPLTLLDDHSRYSLLIKACRDERSETVKAALIEVFREYGLPLGMTMDNGSPWGYSGAQLHTTFSAWLIRLGIYVGHSRPRHPQTQGKLERFHRTLKLELLSRYRFTHLAEAQEGFNEWRQMYNEERPHEAIGSEVPSMRYKKSERYYPEKLPTIVYDSDFIVRKVQQGGVIHFKGKAYRIGRAFCGNPVGLKETNEEGLMDVFFCHQKIVKFDLRYPV